MTKQLNLAFLFTMALLFVLGGTTLAQQNDDEDARILGDKRFRAGRQRANPPRATTKPAAPEAPEAIDAELIGVTFWRLSPATEASRRASSEQDEPARLLIPTKKGAAPQPFHAARIGDDATFRSGELLWLGIEVPRAGESFVYVLDREQYADGSLGEPYLIFPTPTTPPDANVASAGRIVYVPAPDDPLPYFRLERSERKDTRDPPHIAERLTIIVSPRRLTFGGEWEEVDRDIKLLRVETTEAARCDREWSGQTERLPARRDLSASLSAGMTRAEQAVRETRKMIPAKGEQRRLLPADLLPHTIYRVRGKAGQPVLVNVSLRIAP